MIVYPVRYSVHRAALVHVMQQDPQALLIDTRFTPNSRLPAFTRQALRATYGDRYREAGHVLGNVNHRTGGPICLADPERGLQGLQHYLERGSHLVLLCGCRDYGRCHVKVIVELLRSKDPSIEVRDPGTIVPPEESVACLSVRQPWAWLLVHGLKDIENRTWRPRHRGCLLIHASARCDDVFDGDRLQVWRFSRYGPGVVTAMPKAKAGYATGAIIGQITLVDVVERHESLWFNGPYGLVVQQAAPLAQPIPYRGQLQVFEAPGALLASAIFGS